MVPTSIHTNLYSHLRELFPYTLLEDGKVIDRVEKSESLIPKGWKISAHEFHVVPGMISRRKALKILPI